MIEGSYRHMNRRVSRPFEYSDLQEWTQFAARIAISQPTESIVAPILSAS